jgi:hypothetical protein
LFANSAARPALYRASGAASIVKHQVYDSDHENATKNVIPTQLRRNSSQLIA